MSPASPDFFATAAQVIATFVLVYVAEAGLVRRRPPGTWLSSVAAALLVLCVAGVGACLAALSGRPTTSHLFWAVCGLVAAGLLVTAPAVLRLAAANSDAAHAADEAGEPLWRQVAKGLSFFATLVVLLTVVYVQLQMRGRL
jgi:peptidoglycan/LPS O-acetylase OafA/YrhL